jgi:predicted nuclease of restriction endonuclease-like (RecB) superfamily
MTTLPSAPPGYLKWFAALKTRIHTTRLRTALAVNTELIQLYWSIGRDILARQAEHGWGNKIVDRLAADLRVEFPDARGFSRTNLHSMRAFAEAWPDLAIVQRVVGQLPWGQNIELLGIKDPAARIWYAEAALAHGWENASIGLILCREHNRVVVEYALRGVDTPVGVARYQLLAADTLPDDLAGALPTHDELLPGMLSADETDEDDAPR